MPNHASITDLLTAHGYDLLTDVQGDYFPRGDHRIRAEELAGLTVESAAKKWGLKDAAMISEREHEALSAERKRMLGIPDNAEVLAYYLNGKVLTEQEFCRALAERAIENVSRVFTVEVDEKATQEPPALPSASLSEILKEQGQSLRMEGPPCVGDCTFWLAPHDPRVKPLLTLFRLGKTIEEEIFGPRLKWWVQNYKSSIEEGQLTDVKFTIRAVPA